MTVTLFGRCRFLFSALLGIFSLLLFPALAAGQTPLNQVTSNSGLIYQSSVSVPFPDAQQVGGLNVVIVGWNDTSSTVTSVTDSNLNTYFLAAGAMNITAPDVSEVIYVASNIKAGANTVTVTFNDYVAAQDVRLLEYGGPPFLENTTNPLDASVGAAGNTNPAPSGAFTTVYANDLLVASGTITGAFTSIVNSCGTGCTMFNEDPSNPFGDIVADAVVSATGTYQGQANTEGGNWVMEMIAMRVAGQTTIVNPAPTALSVLPVTSPEAGGVAIAITGTNFLPGATVVVTDGTTTVSALNCVVAGAATINCVTPVYSTATTPTLVVTNPDLQATAPPLPFAYTPSTPFTTSGGAGSAIPAGGNTNGGTVISITGSDFASGATVTVGGIRADQVVVQNSTTITATVPAGSVGDQAILVINPSRANGSPGPFTYSFGAGINFVQATSAQPTGTVNVAQNFNIPQTAGNLNVVAIGWADTSAGIQSVTDSAGNTYTSAVGPTQGTGLTQAMYYAKDIVASGSNTVTVRFNGVPTSPDLRIVEYSGLDTVSPFDGGAGAAGTGAFLDSGPVSPTGVGDMIVGAGIVLGAITPALGKGCADRSCLYTTAIFTPYDDNVIHAFPTVAGPFDATANQTPATDPWVMQAVAFKQPAGTQSGFTVGATALSPASIAAGGSATSTVTVTPSGGFANAVTLTCTGLPTGAACSPLSLTPGANPASGTLTITTTSGTPTGTSTVTITGTSGSVTATATVSLVVVAAGSGNFTLTATPTSQTVSPGGTGASVITINPTGGFGGSVTMACNIVTTASPAPICSVQSPATTTANLTVSTTAATAALQHSNGIFYAMLLPIGGITLLGMSFGSRRKKILGVLLVFLMASGLLFLASCSSGGSSNNNNNNGTPGTPAGAYTVTVTGTSGSLTPQTTTFTLTVN